MTPRPLRCIRKAAGRSLPIGARVFASYVFHVLSWIRWGSRSCLAPFSSPWHCRSPFSSWRSLRCSAHVPSGNIGTLSPRVPAILPFPSQRHGNPKEGCTVTTYVCIRHPNSYPPRTKTNFTNEAMSRPSKCDSVPRRTRVLSYHDMTKYSVRQQASSMASWVEAIVSRSGESILYFVDQLQQS